MSILKYGFLSEEMRNVVDWNQQNYKHVFKVYSSINSSIFELLPTLSIRDEHELQDSIILSIFTRSISSYSAVKLLAENAILVEAAATCRNLIEATIYLKYCSLNIDCATKYLIGDYFESKKLAIKMRDNTERFQIPPAEKDRLDLRINELERLINEFNPKSKKLEKLNLETAALQSDLTSLYDDQYTVLCQYTHISPKSLEQFCKRDSDGKIMKMNIFSQEVKDLPIYLGTSINAMMTILNVIEKHFNVKIPQEDIIHKNIEECNIFDNKI